MMTNNNIPQGYKQTELGIIPEDWEVVTVDDVLDMPTKTTSTTSFLSKYYVGTENMYSLKKGIAPHLGRLPYMQVREYQINDILVSNIRPYLKKIWLANRHGGCSSDVIVFRVKDTEIYSSAYIYTILSDDSFFKYVMDSAIGTKMPRGDKAAIKAYSLTIPKDIAEQRAIAEALSDVDGLIAALDKKIAKKRLLKQGAIHQLLTGKKRLHGFTDEWVERKVKDVFRVTRGYVLATNKVVERPDGYYKYPVFSSQTQNNGVMGYYSDYLFEDAITWTTDGANAGEVNYRQGKFYCTNVCGVLISEEGYANECIASIINMVAKSHVSYIGNPKLMNNVMADIEICIPPSIKEQQAIATILSDMDKEIADLEAQCDKYRLLKSGMMQKLLTGQVRLK